MLKPSELIGLDTRGWRRHPHLWDNNTLFLKQPVGDLQGHGHVIYMQIGKENPFQQATF